MDYEIEYRRVPHGENNGLLTVYVNKNGAGEYTEEMFTFASLADVLGLPASTLEGRYARTGLKALKVDVRNAAGRPIRCFPLSRLDEVILVLTTPGASIVTDQPRVLQHGMLAYEEVRGRRYYTPQNLADNYGVTVTTIRSRLKAGGFLKDMVPINASVASGRPRLGFTQEGISAVLKYLDDWAGFRTPVPDRFMQPPASPMSMPSATLAQSTPLAVERTAGPDNVIPLAARPARNEPKGFIADEDIDAFVAETMAELDALALKWDAQPKPEPRPEPIVETFPSRIKTRSLSWVWERHPNLIPEDAEDREALEIWDRFAGAYPEYNPDLDIAQIAPENPDFMNRVRQRFEYQRTKPAEKKLKAYRREVEALEAEKRRVLRGKDPDLERAQALTQEIAAMQRPVVPDVEAFLERIERQLPLMMEIFDLM